MGDDQQSSFFGNFATKVYSEENQQHSTEIHDKIESAFSSIDVPGFEGLIQFWAPVVTSDGRHLLSTSDQPFVLEDLNPHLCKYRLHSVRYQYSIDNCINNNNNDNNSIISNGFVATVFDYRFPEVYLNLRQIISIEDGRSTKDPLVHSALDCDLTSSILLPVFYHSSSCVGVVECCMRPDGLLTMFDLLKSVLERVGLTTYRIQDALPDMTLDSFKRARDEIEDALKFVCESHHLDLGQVWIPHYNNYVSFTSSSLEDPHHTKLTFAVRLSGRNCCVDSDDYDPLKDYYDTSSSLPLKLDEGLPGKTLTTHQPHFWRNLCKPRRVSSVLEILSGEAKCSCRVICSRSFHTEDLDYAFEFFWPRDQWLRPKHVKRKLEDLSDGEGEADIDPFWEDDDDMLMETYYRKEFTLICLLSGYTLANVKKIIEEEFKLDPGTYEFGYMFKEGNWVVLDTDEILANCKKHFRSVKKSCLEFMCCHYQQGDCQVNRLSYYHQCSVKVNKVLYYP